MDESALFPAIWESAYASYDTLVEAYRWLCVVAARNNCPIRFEEMDQIRDGYYSPPAMNPGATHYIAIKVEYLSNLPVLTFTLAHEVAHMKLKHTRTNLTGPTAISIQEYEANALTLAFLHSRDIREPVFDATYAPPEYWKTWAERMWRQVYECRDGDT